MSYPHPEQQPPQQPYQYPYAQQPPAFGQQPIYQQPVYQQPQLRGQDGAQYVRQQKPHSLTKHLLLCLIGVGFITIPMYSISKNHYWTA